MVEENDLMQEQPNSPHPPRSRVRRCRNVSSATDLASTRREEVNFVAVLTMNTVFSVYLCIRGSFGTMWYLTPVTQAAPFCVGFFLGMVAAVASWLSIACRIPARRVARNAMLRRCHDWAVLHQRHQWSGVGTDDVYIVSITAALGAYAVARGLQGPCPEGTSAWAAQTCNPQGASHLLPIDFYVIGMIAPLFAQILFSNASNAAIVTAWMISVACFNAGHYVVGAAPDNYIWLNFTFLFFMYSSYEIKNSFVERFLLTKAVRDNEWINVELLIELQEARVTAMETEMVTKRAMVRHIAHEIRTPLNSIVGGLECLNQEIKKVNKRGASAVVIPPIIFELLIQCGESCKDARETASKLLSFEKIAAGLEKLELEVVPVQEYMYKVVQPFIFQARAKGVEMTIEVNDVDENTCVKIDPVKMAQVLRNFLSNAVKFTVKREKILVLLRGASAKGDNNGGDVAGAVTVLVTDKGPGLTTDQLGELFQEGVQFNANQNQAGGGTSFGLFIAKGVVNLHEGASCGATSEGLGHGSTFYVTIPTTTEAPPAAVDIAAQGGVSVLGGAGGTSDAPTYPVLNILCVNDSIGARKMLMRSLTHYQQQCFEADDGLVAFTMVKNSLNVRDVSDTTAAAPHFDAVCMDNNMLTMDGPDAARLMRQVGFNGPIIGIAGHEDSADYVAAGVDIVLVKPIRAEDVLKAIATATTQRAAAAAASAGDTPVARSQPPLPRIRTASVVAQNPIVWSASVRDMPSVTQSVKRAARTALFFAPGSSGGGGGGISSGDESDVDSGDESGTDIDGLRLRLMSMRGPTSTDPGAVSAARAALDARRASRTEGLDASESASYGVAPSALAALPAVDRAVVLDEALTVRWEDLVTYTLQFKRQEHRTKEVLLQFDEYRRSQFNLKVGAYALLNGLVWNFTRGSVDSFWRQNALFTVAFILALLCGPIVVIAWFVRLAVISRRYNITWMLPYHDWAVGISRSHYRNWCENAVMILVPLQVSLYVLARVIQGVCPPGTSMWNSQRCNPGGLELPLDATLLAVISVIPCQTFLLGASYSAMAFGVIINFVVLNTAMVLAGSKLILWVNLVILLCAAISYEYERIVVVAFAKMLLLVAAKDEANKQEVQRALTDERDAARFTRDAMQSMISKTGHDLKSPVTAMGMSLEGAFAALRGDFAVPPPPHAQRVAHATRPCAEVHAALMHVQMICNRASNYGLMLAGVRLTPNVRAVNVVTVMRAVAQCKAINADVSVEVEGPAAGIVAVGATDPSWLQDNLLCVVDNACKVTRLGSGNVRVSVRAVVSQRRQLVEITVRDSGDETLSDTQLRALFDRPVDFRRDAVGGMGTGMCCLAARVKALDGDCGARRRADNEQGTDVWFRVPFDPPAGDSSSNSGAEVSVFLDMSSGRHRAPPASGEVEVFAPEDFFGPPVDAVPDVSAAASAAAEPPRADDLSSVPNAKPLAGLRILVVDDSAPIRKVMQRTLTGAGAAVETAIDGKEAVDMVNACVQAGAGAACYDIIVTDIQMPRMDGWAASKAIRSLPHCSPRELVIVGMSAQGQGDMSDKWKEAGMDSFMAKPFGVAMLVDMVRSRRRGVGVAGGI